MCIAAIERNGGMITTKYYDFHATQAMSDPFKFFKSGKQKNIEIFIYFLYKIK
jgi:hypothetical protein